MIHRRLNRTFYRDLANHASSKNTQRPIDYAWLVLTIGLTGVFIILNNLGIAS